MARAPSHRYTDPLDHIWLSCARAIGLRVRRAPDAYASTDGRGEMTVGDRDLDDDDCLAQMIAHELCHSLIEGPESFKRPDWGLENTDLRHAWRERACLRLQAHLTAGYGLHRVLAPTTEFREFYDGIAANPLSPRSHPEVALAILGLQRADKPPWGPHFRAALAATAGIARAAGAFPNPEPTPSLWTTAETAAEQHPSGLPGSTAAGGQTCARCAWHFVGGSGKAVDRCRQADNTRVEPDWPACERFETIIDCQECGACCREAYHSVTVSKRDPVVTTHPVLIVKRERYYEIARKGNRCAALEGGNQTGDTLTPFRCVIYDDRPRNCREFANSGEHCLVARRRVGLSL